MAPLTPRGEFPARQERRAQEHPRERGTQGIGQKAGRAGDKVSYLRFQLRAVAALRDEALDKLVGEAKRFTVRHAEAE